MKSFKTRTRRKKSRGLPLRFHRLPRGKDRGFRFKALLLTGKYRRRGRRRRSVVRSWFRLNNLCFITGRGSELIDPSQTALVCLGEKASANIAPVKASGRRAFHIFPIPLAIEGNVKRILYRGYWGVRGQYDGHDDGRRRCTLNTKEFVNARVCAHCNLNETLKFFSGPASNTHISSFP